MTYKIESYKGFDRELKCRGYQYEVGETYEHDGDVNLCLSGFHACPAPIDTFSCYPPATSRYAVVEQSGILIVGGDEVASSIIKIKAEINVDDIVKAQIGWVESRSNDDDKEYNTGDYSVASNTGDYSVASNTGHQSVATNTGDYSAATNTGDYSAASNTGDYSVATNTGDYSVASNTGDYSAASNIGYQSAVFNSGDQSVASNTGYQSTASNTGYQSTATNTGDGSTATNTGDCSAATNTGDCSAACVSGEQSVAFVTGYSSKARASKGSWVVITERNSRDEIINIKTAQAGDEIKPDTYYIVRNGEFVEVGE